MCFFELNFRDKTQNMTENNEESQKNFERENHNIMKSKMLIPFNYDKLMDEKHNFDLKTFQKAHDISIIN